MFSIADMAVAGAVALLLFGPDQLPKVARRAGQLVRDVQNTSQSFIREMERAADTHETPVVAEPYTLAPPGAPLYHAAPEPAAHDIGINTEPSETSIEPLIHASAEPLVHPPIEPLTHSANEPLVHPSIEALIHTSNEPLPHTSAEAHERNSPSGQPSP